MSKELAPQVHRQTILFQHAMLDNTGELEAFDETGTPVWGTDYVTLSSETLESFKEFRYGVLTFDAHAVDWTDVILGFGDFSSGRDYVVYRNDSFSSEKNNLGVATTATALTDSTWYHFQITWCPQFVSIEVWTHAGALEGYAKHRNPPSIPLILWFQATTSDNLYIANVVVQEGDDAVFFLDKRTNVWGDAFALSFATYNYTTFEKWVQLAGADQRCGISLAWDRGHTHYYYRIWYMTDGNPTAWVYIADGARDECRYPNIRVNGVITTFPISPGGAYCWTYLEFGPYSITDPTDGTIMQNHNIWRSGTLLVFGGQAIVYR